MAVRVQRFIFLFAGIVLALLIGSLAVILSRPKPLMPPLPTGTNLVLRL
jgi:hypothetical protein